MPDTAWQRLEEQAGSVDGAAAVVAARIARAVRVGGAAARLVGIPVVRRIARARVVEVRLVARARGPIAIAADTGDPRHRTPVTWRGRTHRVSRGAPVLLGDAPLGAAGGVEDLDVHRGELVAQLVRLGKVLLFASLGALGQ